MTDDELVDGYGQACLEAGRSNSGLCISAGASGDWQEMQRWREAVKRRLRELAAAAKAPVVATGGQGP